jgi:hypothetical protein
MTVKGWTAHSQPTQGQTPTVTTNAIWSHLRTYSQHDSLHLILNDELLSLGLHTCRFCNTPKTLYTDQPYLKSHMTRCHSTTRTKKTHLLIADCYPQTPVAAWSPVILWLHHLDIHPPAHRGNVWRLLNLATHKEYLSTLHNILRCILLAAEIHPDTSILPILHTSPAIAFWKLLLLLDPLLLGYPQPTEPPNVNTAVGQCLHLFRQGQIKILHNQMLSIPLQPTPDSPIAFASDDDLCLQAENLINLDNYQAGHQRIQSALPVTTMSDHIKSLCQKLYPPRICRTTRNNARHAISPNPPLGALKTGHLLWPFLRPH